MTGETNHKLQMPGSLRFKPGFMMKQKLHSRVQSVQKVEEIVEQLAAELSLPEEKYGNIYISLMEAITNAIKHGNDEDETKVVEIEAKIEKASTCVAFRITDQGEGFDYNNLPDPTSEEHLTKTGGRGVFIMRELCDEMYFLNNGRTVELRFNI